MGVLKCPNCGSEKLVFYREILSVYITPITKDSKLPKRKSLSYTDDNFPHHVDCEDCKSMFNYNTNKEGKITELWDL